MALTEPLDLLSDFPGRPTTFELAARQEQSRHASGRTRVKDFGTPIWRGAWQSRPLSRAALDHWRARLEHAMINQMTFVAYERCRPMAHQGSFPVGGESLNCNFATGNYAVEGNEVVASSAISCVRASTGYALNAANVWQEFANDEARITDLGLLIEPAATDISLFPVEGSSWVTAQATAADDAVGPYLGVFTDPQTVTSTATTLNTRVRSSSGGTPVVASTQYALTFWVKAGSTSIAGLFGTVSAGTSRLTVDLANGYSVVSSSNSRGDMTFVSGRLVGDVHEIKVLWTPSATAGADIGAGPGSGVSGDTLIVVGFRMEVGTEHYSPSGPGAGSAVTRAADAVTLALPSGTHTLTLIFDDESTQVVSGQSYSYAIPTDLSRRLIKSIVAVKTSASPVALLPEGELADIGDDNKTVSISGLAGITLRVGDHIRIGTGLHRVMEPKAGDPTGMFEVSPHLWPGTAEADEVVIDKPWCLMTIDPGSVSAPADQSGRGSVSFSATEAR